MPSRERVQAFVDAVLAKDFVQSIRDFYGEDATVQENLQPPRVGREALIAHETKSRLDELSLQTWRGDRIVTERFFYDPASIQPVG